VIDVEAPAQVVVGELTNPQTIKTAENSVKIGEWDDRARWSWLRLQRGRRVDDEIKASLEAEKEWSDIFKQLMPQKQRPVQYIMIDGDVKAVASTKHLLIPPEEVTEAARDICTRQELEQDYALDGLIGREGEVAGIQVGWQIDPGNILTRRAISVSSWASTVLCTNPLSWAGIGNFGRFGLKPEHTRVLRIQDKTELRPRLERAITTARKEVKALEDLIERSKTTKVKPQEARMILAAFAKAYRIGLKSIKEVTRLLEVHPRTTYGMAQAASWEARHGESFRKTADGEVSTRTRQAMATVGAACLLIEQPEPTYQQAMKWLKGQWPTVKEDLEEA